MYLTDPKNGKKSVTLTFLVISFITLLGFSAAVALGKAETIGTFPEIFYMCSALYFGRRAKIGTKSFSMDNGESETKND